MTAGLLLALLLASSAPRPREADLTAVRQLAAQVAADLAEHRAEAPIAVHARSDSPDLSLSFATVLCAELAQRKLSCTALDGVTLRDAESTARERGARSLARLNLVLEHGILHARGDLLGTWVNFWSGLTPTRPASPSAAVEHSVDADAYILALLATPLTPTSQVQPQAGELSFTGAMLVRVPSWIAALTAADLDGDRKAELLALTEDELLIYSAEGKLLARRDTHALPPSPTPCREPYGFVSVLQNPLRIRYQVSRRKGGELLAYERGALRPLPSTDELPILEAGRTAFFATLQPGTTTAQSQVSFSGEAPVLLAGGPWTTLSAFALPSAGAFLLAVAPDGNALVTSGPGREAKVGGLGSGSALADVDGDGFPELVSTSAEFAPATDELTIYPLPQASTPDALSKIRFRAPIQKGRALAVTGADVDGDGAQEVAVAVWLPDGTSELQLFRRAAQ